MKDCFIFKLKSSHSSDLYIDILQAMIREHFRYSLFKLHYFAVVFEYIMNTYGVQRKEISDISKLCLLSSLQKFTTLI